jgi:hypothetical protein
VQPPPPNPPGSAIEMSVGVASSRERREKMVVKAAWRRAGTASSCEFVCVCVCEACVCVCVERFLRGGTGMCGVRHACMSDTHGCEACICVSERTAARVWGGRGGGGALRSTHLVLWLCHDAEHVG